MGDTGDEEDPTARRTQRARPGISNPSGYPDFGPRYRVLGVLGKGGMGEVYRAYDAELHGEVALKAIRNDGPEMDDALGRFRREIALARKITSPYVLRVYDLAEYEGLRFLSMELVEGEDLATLLRREKTLPVDRALSIFGQMCAGVAAAHKQGVVHRDLKPQNILLGHGDAVRIADFGLARVVDESGITALGAVLGTPDYMSPEQVRGELADERSDIYSLGIILYELLAGSRPFRGDSSRARMEMRLNEKPVPLRDLAPHVPLRVETLVTKCLERDPAQRYSSIAALRADLERALPGSGTQRVSTSMIARPDRLRGIAIGAATVVALAALVVIAMFTFRSDESPEAPVRDHAGDAAAATAEPRSGAPAARTRVLLLPTDNRTAQPLLDDTIDLLLYYALRRSMRLEPITPVKLRQLVAQLVGEARPVDDAIARQLAERDGVEVLVVRSTATLAGREIRIALAVSDARSGKSVATRELAPVALERVPETIGAAAADLRRALGEDVPVHAEDAPISPSLEAVHSFAIGIQAGLLGDDQGALAPIQRAIELDPEFSLAYLGLGNTMANLNRPGDARTQFELGLKSIDRLGERDRLHYLANYYLRATQQFERAIEIYRVSLDKWPADLSGQVSLAIAYLASHDIARALEVQRKAFQDHPHDVTVLNNLMAAELLAGNAQAVLEHGTKMLAEHPRVFATVHLYMALAHAMLGRRDAAQIAYAKHAAEDPSLGVTADADFALAEGRVQDAITLLERGIAADTEAELSDAAQLKRLMLAEAHWRLGKRARAQTLAAKVSTTPSRAFEAGLLLADTGDTKRAATIARTLAAELGADPRAYAKLLEGELLRLAGKPRDAMLVMREGLAIANVWIGHVLRSRAALEAGEAAEAYAEIQTAIARRGEGVIAVDDTPSYRQIPPLTYYLGRAQEAVGSSEAAASYRAFIALHHGSGRAPLVEDARARLARLE